MIADPTRVCKPHQGYSNYPTWVVILWLSNDKWLYQEKQRLLKAANSIEEAKDSLFALVDEMHAVCLHGLAADIFTWAFDQVNWEEIISHETDEFPHLKELSNG